MRGVSVWRELLGLSDAVVEDVELDPAGGVIVARVRVRKGAALRCSRCRAVSPRYDRGEGRRRWRHLDAGTLRVFIEAEVPPVACRACGVVVAFVPWAHAGTGHTHDFDRQVAYLATRTSKTTVVELMRIAWRTVGAIITRYWQDVEDCYDRYDGLRRIGIDEIAYKKGRKYLTVVVDHDTGRLVWAGIGRESATLEEFFEILGPVRCAQITLVSADAARYIARAVGAHLPHAVQCADPFHVIAWATDALDQVRREAWNTAKGRAINTQLTRQRSHGDSRALKNTRLALWKNPENLTDRQLHQLEWVEKTDPRLWRAYLLKEGLRYAVNRKGTEGKVALEAWIAWARRCRIPAFVELQRKIMDHLPAVEAMMDSGLSNALVESTNTKIRLLTRVAFGFHGPAPLIALAMLALGGHCPALPGRNRPTD